MFMSSQNGAIRMSSVNSGNGLELKSSKPFLRDITPLALTCKGHAVFHSVHYGSLQRYTRIHAAALTCELTITQVLPVIDFSILPMYK